MAEHPDPLPQETMVRKLFETPTVVNLAAWVGTAGGVTTGRKGV